MWCGPWQLGQVQGVSMTRSVPQFATCNVIACPQDGHNRSKAVGSAERMEAVRGLADMCGMNSNLCCWTSKLTRDYRLRY